ncbi:MAG: FISUMP domain-containing protein [Bacteroidota bacterium]|nr:FISUMP domain-containing protein [Bacteroidota bacterium]
MLHNSVIKLIIPVSCALLLCSSCNREDENTPPVAGFSLSPYGGNTEVIYSFDASESYDNEDSLSQLRFRWDWESDGRWDTDWLSETVHQHRYIKSGVYQIDLQVIDTDGAKTISFEFLQVDEFFLLDARDDAQYKTVQIGSQLWMAENLNYETHSGSWCYNDSIENCIKFGSLYDWHAAQNACPPGWKLPDIEDWSLLFNTIGDNPGDKLRSTSGWNSGHNGLDTYGFNAKPASFRHDYGSYSSTDSYAYFWSANSFNLDMAWSWLMSYNSSDIEQNYLNKGNAFSVRCLRY